MPRKRKNRSRRREWFDLQALLIAKASCGRPQLAFFTEQVVADVFEAAASARPGSQTPATGFGCRLVFGTYVAFLLQPQEDFLGGFFGGQCERVDGDLGVGWDIVRIADAGEFFDDAG